MIVGFVYETMYRYITTQYVLQLYNVNRERKDRGSGTSLEIFSIKLDSQPATVQV